MNYHTDRVLRVPIKYFEFLLRHTCLVLLNHYILSIVNPLKLQYLYECFDCVDYKILIDKISEFDITGAASNCSYLSQ